MSLITECARERYHRIQSNRELRKSNIELNDLFQKCRSLQEKCNHLQEQPHRPEQCVHYQAYLDAQAMIQNLQHELSLLNSSHNTETGSPVSPSVVFKEKIQMEMELTSLRNRVKELEQIVQEDKNRITALCNECREESARLVQENKTMERYKIAYMNVKKRNEERTKKMMMMTTMMNDSNEYIQDPLNEESCYYRCREKELNGD